MNIWHAPSLTEKLEIIADKILLVQTIDIFGVMGLGGR